MRVFLNICLLLEECNLIFQGAVWNAKISNKFYLKVLRINFMVAMIILILGFSVVLYSTYLA